MEVDVKKIFLGITGASGVIYSAFLLKELKKLNTEVYVVVTEGGWLNLKKELNIGKDEIKDLAFEIRDAKDMDTPLASGSLRLSGCVIAPCTTSTAARIAHGIQDNLITRAAGIALKEKWPLILMVRETPLSPPTLKALYELSLSGVVIMPASPGFYHHPKNINDVVNFMVDRVLKHLGFKGTMLAYKEQHS